VVPLTPGTVFWNSLQQDLAFAFRSLRKRPAFSAIVVVTLGVGIGVVTAMFAVAHGILLRPLPITDQDRVVLVRKEAPRDRSLRPFPVADLAALRERTRTFASVAGVQYDGAFPAVAQLGDRAITVVGTLVSGELFRVLGVRPAAGRTLLPTDAAPDAQRVVLISHGLWQRQFGGDASVIGRTLHIQSPYTIVGVAPRGFDYPKGVEVWVPLRLVPEVVNSREFAPFSIIGRLRPGATVEQSQREVAAFVREREAVYLPGESHGQRAVVMPFADAIVGEVRSAILILSAAVGLVLVIVVVNVANLLLIRGAARSRELAVRTALGAGRGRIARQLCTETAVLAAAGSLIGVLLARWAVRGLAAMAPPELPRLGDVVIDVRILAFAVAATAATALACGLAPALWTARTDLQAALRGGARAGWDSRGTQLVKQSLIVAQVALACIVAAGAGLLTKSLARLQQVEMGFVASRITLVKVALPHATYAERARRMEFFDRVSARVGATPGVQAATPVILAPFSGLGGWDATYTVEGQGPREAAENSTLNLEAVAPNYFDVLGIAIVRGRAFTPQDREGAVRVAVVSEALARRAWPGRDPLGKRLKFGAYSSPRPWLTVVGVVRETRYRELASAPPSIYVPFRQAENPGLLPNYVAVRSTADAGVVLRAVRQAANELDATVPVLDAEPVHQLLAGPLARPRFNALLLVGLSAIALVLAAVGLYGVIASFVGQRTHEIGVRMALGAQAGHVRRLVFGKGMLLTGIGATVGSIGALAATRALSSLLYDVRPSDPATLVGAAALLLAIAAVACYAPARQASRVDPLVALRAD
jgi:putative ABC transport system permease protein